MSMDFMGSTAAFRGVNLPAKPSGEILVRDEGIGSPLHAKGRKRTMAGNERHIVAERPEPLADRADKGAVIAPRKVCPADGALEKNVADNGEPRRFVEEDDMPRRVTGAVAHVEGEPGVSRATAQTTPRSREEHDGPRRTATPVSAAVKIGG